MTVTDTLRYYQPTGMMQDATEITYTILQYVVTGAICIIGILVGVLVLLNIIYFARLKRILFVDLIRPDKPGFWGLMLDAAKGQSKKYKYSGNTYKDPKGIVIGLNNRGRFICSPEEAEEHIYVNGGTGSGKTILLISSLRQWRGRAFVIDISGDISKKTAKYRRNKLVFCPWSGSGLPYDIYHPLRKYEGKPMTPAIEDAINDFFSKLCFALIPDAINLGDTERYYRNGGRAMLTAALVYYYRSGWDFIVSCRDFCKTDTFTLLEKINYMDCEFIKTMTSQFLGESEKNVAGCKSSANSFLQIYATKNLLDKHIRKPKLGEKYITPEMIEKHDIYVIIPEKQLEDYAPLLALLTSQMMQYVEARKIMPYSPKILMCVDEFGRMGQLKNCLAFLRTARKRRARMMILTQSVVDFELNYGDKEAEAMLDNLGLKICLVSNHPKTQEYFAGLVGRDYEIKDTQSWGVTTDNYGRMAAKDYIVEPAELQYLPKKDRVLYVSPDGYALLRKYKYWEDKKRYPEDYAAWRKSKKAKRAKH